MPIVQNAALTCPQPVHSLMLMQLLRTDMLMTTPTEGRHPIGTRVCAPRAPPGTLRDVEEPLGARKGPLECV